MTTTRFIKGYELREQIGIGGFGEVWRADQTSIDRPVAIKLILPKFANHPDFIRRFEAEAQLIARLEHLHIVPLFDYWRDPDGAYLVMRYLRGGSLKKAIASGGLELPQVAQIISQITAALDRAHQQGVIHRDIKPSNIMLDEDENAYLSDFGIAKDLFGSADLDTQSGQLMASPPYAAPEQARSDPVSPRTDIYSLGVTLYEMLMGQHPFPNLTAVELFYKHLNEPLPEIKNLPPDVSDSINEVIQKATAKNPAHRYADALEMAAAFRQAANLDTPRSDSSIVELLTQREQEILQLLIDNKSNKEIAAALVVAPSTIKWYNRQIFKKLGVNSRVQAIVRARELDLIVPSGAADHFIELTYIPTADFQPENPYKGLRAFQSADNQDFFGREKITHKLIKRLSEKDEWSRFLAVVGPSGSGKSSLVKAGLIPAIWRGDIPSSEKWYVIDMIPGAYPFDELEVALTKIAANQSENLHAQLTRDDRGLIRIAQLILPDDDTELLIVIDQFEEVFTLVEDEKMRTRFLDLLYKTITDKRSRVRIVITLRADFYDRPLQYPDFGELVRNRMETVLPLTAKELEQAIVKPAARTGVTFEEGLVAHISDEVAYQPGALPLLQYALTELFERRDGHVLTQAAYQAVGGAIGALAKRADDIYHAYDDTGQATIQQLFLRLVTLGEGTEDTRRRVHRVELLSLTHDEDLMDDIIDTYADYRLLSLDHDPATRTPTVEVAHEAILREWERLRTWLNESRDDIRQQRLVAHAAIDWQVNNQDKSYLLHGSRLEQLETWHTSTALSMTSLETEFISASIKQREVEMQAETARQIREQAHQKRSRTLLRALVAVFALAALVSTGFGIFAFNQRRETRAALGDAETALGETEAALDTAQRSGFAFAAYSALQEGHVDVALALAMESVGDNDAELLPETQVVLEKLSETEGPHFLWSTSCIWYWSDSYDLYLDVNCYTDPIETWSILDPLTNQILATGPVSPNFSLNFSWMVTRFSPNNAFFVISASDIFAETVQFEVWKTDDLSQVSSLEIDHPIIDLAWSADSTMLATVDMLPENLPQARDEGIYLGSSVSFWDPNTGELVRRINIDAPYYQYLGFSHDGTMGIVGGWSSFEDDKQYQVTIFDIDSGATLYQFEREPTFYRGQVPGGAGWDTIGFTADDRMIWFTGFPNYVIDLATGENYGHLHELDWCCTNLSADLNYAWNASPNEAMRWANLQTGEQSTLPPGFATTYPTAANDTVVTSFLGRDGWYVWEMQGREGLVATLSLGELPMVYASYSPDGKYVGFVKGIKGLYTGSETAIYHADTFEEAYHVDTDTNLPYDLAWSPDSRYFATVTDSEGVILWDAETGQEVRRFVDIEPQVKHQYDPNAGQMVERVIDDEPVPVEQVEFTPDGRRIVSGRHSRTYMSEGSPYLLVWDVESGELLQRIEMPSSTSENLGVHWLTMHPTQNRVYVSIDEGGGFFDPDGMGSYLVDLDTGVIEKIEKDFSPYAAVFTPDGSKLIFSAFGDGNIRVFDVATHTLLNKWHSNQGGISGIAISPDGRSLLTNSNYLSNETIISAWDVETGQLIRTYRHEDLQQFLVAVNFSPDGNQFVTTSWDGGVRVWAFSPQTSLDWIRENRVIPPFTCEEREIYHVEPLCEPTEG